MTAGHLSADPAEVSLTLSRQAGERGRTTPLEAARLTDPQRLFVSIVHRLALWRGGNQMGKSHGLAYDVVHSLLGTHPYRPVRKPPVKLVVAGESWSSMDPLLEKIWDFLPKDQIDERCYYDPGGGIRGFKDPRVPIVSGPAKGSLLVLRTYGQGAKKLAGRTLHGGYCDEPPPPSFLGELLPRLSKHHGFLRIGMTPTPETVEDCAHIRELLEEDAKRPEHDRLWYQLQTSVNLANLTIRGGLFEKPWKTRKELQELFDTYLAIERDMRIHGAWDPVVKGRWLTAFEEDHIWRGELGDELPGGQRVWIAVGIDHGAKAGRQCAVLVVCSEDGELLWFLDEARSDGRTSYDEDAAAVIAMLQRHGWSWENVDYWIGDRAHGGDEAGNEKSNADLLQALSRKLKIPASKLQQRGLKIATPRKFRGSMHRGIRIMNSLFKARQAKVHERCQGVIRGAKEWKGRLDDPAKDPLDAARYPVELLTDLLVLRPRYGAAAAIY